MAELFSNNPQTTLNGAITSGAVSLVVTSATNFSSSGNFRILIDAEIFLVTAVAGTTFTVTPGSEGTTQANHANGATVTQILTAGALGGQSDAAVATPSLRSLGTGAQQAMAGNAVTGEKNAFVNGNFDVWQGGTSFAAAANAAYTADQFQWTFTGTGVVTCAQSTDIPTAAQSGVQGTFSHKITVTTADVSIAAGDRYACYSQIEGNRIRWLLGSGNFTISFWVKAHRTGTYCVAFENSAATETYPAEYTISVADTWEKKTITVTTMPGTWVQDTGLGMTVIWTLAAGSNFQGTNATWNGTGAHATSNQVNGVGATSDVFQLAQIQLEPGLVATPFELRPYPYEYWLCQRYYEILGGTGIANDIDLSGYMLAGSSIIRTFPIIPKRVTPTVTKNGTWLLNNGNGPTVDTPTVISFRAFTTATVNGFTQAATNSIDDTIVISARF